MKILHVIQRYPPAIGGSELWCSNITRTLAKRGIFQEVATINLHNIEQFFREIPPEERTVNLGRFDFDDAVFITRYDLWTFYSRRISLEIVNFLLNRLNLGNTSLGKIFRHSPNSLEMYRVLFKRIKEFDIVHLYTLPYFHNIMAYSIARFYKKSIVITPFFHSGHSDYEKKIFYNIMKKCDAVIVLSNFEKETLIKKGIEKTKICVTGCFCEDKPVDDGKDFVRFKENLVKKYNIQDSAKKIIFIGIKLFYKGIDVLMEAARQLSEEKKESICLFLVGPSSTEFRNKYPCLTNLGRLKVIDFSTVSDRDKDHLIRFSDALALPSKYESFGIVFLEAWKYGKPVIGSTAGPIPEVIEGGGLCSEYGNVADLKDKLETLLFDKNISAELGRRGKEKTETVYSEKTISDKVFDVYRKIRRTPKRILVVSQLFPPGALGGSEIVAYEQSKRLKKMGYDVSVFAGRLDDNRERFSMTNEKTSLRISRVNLHSIDFSHHDAQNLSKIPLEEVFRKKLFDFTPDIVHFHNIYAFTPNLVDICSERRIPAVMTLHDYWSICFKNLLLTDAGKVCERKDGLCSECVFKNSNVNGKRFSASLRNAYIMRCLEKVSLFISPSRFLADRFIMRGIPACKVKIINNGIDISRFKDTKKTKSKEVRFGYIGQIVEHKGIENLLMAFSLLPERYKDKMSLSLVGTGERLFVEYCRELLKKMKIEKQVKIMGNIDNRRIGRIFNGIDILVVPSIWPENSPVSIMEALATATPSLVSDIGGMPELVKNGEEGFLHKYDDASSLKQNMVKVIETPGLIEKMREACIKKAGYFDISKQMKMISDEYEKIFGNL